VSGSIDEILLIEVKSKRAKTETGVANVVHCKDHKIDGVRGFPPATHFAVLLVDDEGRVEDAWLFPTASATSLRRIQESLHSSARITQRSFDVALRIG